MKNSTFNVFGSFLVGSILGLCPFFLFATEQTQATHSPTISAETDATHQNQSTMFDEMKVRTFKNKKLNSEIVSKLKKGMNEVKKVGHFTSQISKQFDILYAKRHSLSMSSAKSILRPTTQSLRMINLYLNDAYKEFDKASEIAYLVNCLDSKEAIDGLSRRVDKVRSYILKANEAMRKGTTSRGDSYIRQQITLPTDEFENAMNVYDLFNDDIDNINQHPCYKKEVVNTIKNSTPAKVVKPWFTVGMTLRENRYIDYPEIARVFNGSASQNAGLKVGDIVIWAKSQDLQEGTAAFAENFLRDRQNGKAISVKVYTREDGLVKTFELNTGASDQFKLIKAEPFKPLVKTLEFSDAVYEGETRYGEAHGQGEMKFSETDYYTGEFKDGIIHGQGIRHYSNESFVEGTFKAGKPHGDGVVNFASGNYYEGVFKNGKKHGLFVSTINGEKFRVTFDMDKTLSKTLIEDNRELQLIQQEIKQSL